MTEFNRERFLLRLIAGVVLAQLAFYGVGAMVCSYRFASSNAKLTEGACQTLQLNINRSSEIALNVLLALLGAGAVAADAMSGKGKRREDEKPSPPPEENDPRY
jgi:hypothetical protein